MDPSRLRENDILHRDYRLLDRLGAGSFGAVYAAQHTPSELLVAVKVVRDEDCEMRRRKGRSMPREYAALRRLEGHPGILRAHHYFHDSGMFFMVMEPHGTRWTKVNGGYTVQEYILHGDGRPGDLGAAMRARALPGCEKSVFRIFSQIASAVAHMHANGIAHRDLKPENILIDDQYQIKLADFGLAAFIDDSGRYDHYSVGTGYYMPPEVAKPSRRYRMFPADIFALGMILWELVQLPGGPRVYEAAFPVVSLQTTHPSGLWPSDDRWHACRRVFRSCGRQKADRRPTAHDVLRSRWFVLHRTADAGSA